MSSVASEAKLDGIVLSTDEFFIKDGKYTYDNSKLSDAHEWNQRRGQALARAGHAGDETLGGTAGWKGAMDA